MNTLISLFFPVLALQHISSIEHEVEAKAFSSYCRSWSNLQFMKITVLNILPKALDVMVGKQLLFPNISNYMISII